jgi:hypothetical protein
MYDVNVVITLAMVILLTDFGTFGIIFMSMRIYCPRFSLHS